MLIQLDTYVATSDRYGLKLNCLWQTCSMYICALSIPLVLPCLQEMERRRAAVRERARLLAHQAATQEMLAKEEEVEAESEEEEESEYEEYSDSEDELGPRLKPVFVRK